jgi:hypothetical protein
MSWSPNSQLLEESKVFKNYILFASEYKPWKLKDELGKYFHDCFFPKIPIESILIYYSWRLHKWLKLDEFEFFNRTIAPTADCGIKGLRIIADSVRKNYEDCKFILTIF